jgi:hypothetical protein
MYPLLLRTWFDQHNVKVICEPAVVVFAAILLLKLGKRTIGTPSFRDPLSEVIHIKHERVASSQLVAVGLLLLMQSAACSSSAAADEVMMNK